MHTAPPTVNRTRFTVKPVLTSPEQRPNPKSLTRGQSQLWNRVAHGECVGVDSEVDIR